jgi:hypothetical protein
MNEAQPSVADTESKQGVHQVPFVLAPDTKYMQQQIFLLEDTVMTMSMAVTTISTAIRSWEKLLLPMMMGFVLLASFGFYLIYNLAHDVSVMSDNVAKMAISVDKNMTIISSELVAMRKDVDNMSAKISSVDKNLSEMSTSVDFMRHDIATVNASMSQMVTSTNRMGTDLWDLNRSISGPMSTVNNIAPWRMMGGRKEPPPPPQAVSQPNYPYPYGTPEQQQSSQQPPAAAR